MRAAVAFVLASCSFANVRGPAPAPQPAGDCTTSLDAVHLDELGMGIAIGGGTLGTLAVSLGSVCTADAPCDDSKRYMPLAFGITAAAVAVVYLASAIHGYNTVDACRARRAAAP